MTHEVIEYTRWERFLLKPQIDGAGSRGYIALHNQGQDELNKVRDLAVWQGRDEALEKLNRKYYDEFGYNKLRGQSRLREFLFKLDLVAVPVGAVALYLLLH